MYVYTNLQISDLNSREFEGWKVGTETKTKTETETEQSRAEQTSAKKNLNRNQAIHPILTLVSFPLPLLSFFSLRSLILHIRVLHIIYHLSIHSLYHLIFYEQVAREKTKKKGMVRRVKKIEEINSP